MHHGRAAGQRTCRSRVIGGDAAHRRCRRRVSELCEALTTARVRNGATAAALALYERSVVARVERSSHGAVNFSGVEPPEELQLIAF